VRFGSHSKNITALYFRQVLGLTVCYSIDGKHLPKEIPDECNMVFICDKFEGKVFEYLNEKGFRSVLMNLVPI